MTEGLVWVKSSRSGSDGSSSACVEVARTAEAVHVRDSKDRDGGRLIFTRAEWAAFLAGAAAGEFDL